MSIEKIDINKLRNLLGEEIEDVAIPEIIKSNDIIDNSDKEDDSVPFLDNKNTLEI